MTTVVYRNGMMAADTGSSYGDSKISGVRKIARAPDGSLYGICGNASLGREFLEWVRKGCEGDHPAIPLDQEGNNEMVALHVDASGGMYLITHYGREDMTGFPYMAIGADATVAFGALFQGATADEAVMAAIEHGKWTFGSVYKMRLGKDDAIAPPIATNKGA